MRLLRSTEVEGSPGTSVFRYSRLRALLLTISVIALGITGILLGRWQFAGVTRFISYYVGAVLLLLLYVFRGYVTARFRRSNWLAQVDDKGVFLKFRSYLNYALPDTDQTVVFIPFQEIRSARLLTERRASSNTQGSRTTRTSRYIEFDLAVDVAGLRNSLSAERIKPAPSQKRWFLTTSTLYRHFPVRVVSPSFVQVQWSAVPGRSEFMQVLAPFVQLASPMDLTEDLDTLATLTREQQFQRLRELDDSGHFVLAVAIARRLYGYDVPTAKDFLEKLQDANGFDQSRMQ
jgi:hypothetical protein